MDPVVFRKLTEQAVGRWIDPEAKARGVSKWKENVLAKVVNGAGNSPRGENTRVGVLVRHCSVSIKFIPYSNLGKRTLSWN